MYIFFNITSLSRICSHCAPPQHTSILCSHLAFSTTACDLFLSLKVYLGATTVILKEGIE